MSDDAPPAPPEDRESRDVFTLSAAPLPPPATCAEGLAAGTLRARYGMVGSGTPVRRGADGLLRVGPPGPGERTWSEDASAAVVRGRELPWTLLADPGLLAFRARNGDYVLRDAAGGGRRGAVSWGRPAGEVIFSPGGAAVLAYHGDPRAADPGPERGWSAWSLPTGEPLAQGELRAPARAFAVATSGARWALASEDGWVTILDGADFRVVASFGIESAWAPATLALSRDGTRLVTAARTGEILLWDADDGARVATSTRTYPGRGQLLCLEEGMVHLLGKGRLDEVWFEVPRASTPEVRMVEPAAEDLGGPGVPDHEEVLVGAPGEDPAAPARAFRRKDGAEMLRVPAGTLRHGDPHFEVDATRYPAGALHDLEVGAFWVDRFPVTVARYARYVEATGAAPPDDWEAQLAHPRRPVVFVSHEDARGYAGWAGAALPTEAEWERAARGDGTDRFPWPAGREGPLANFRGDGVPALADVDAHPAGASPLGVLDLAGNAAEWCADRYRADLGYDPWLRDPPDRWSGPCRVVKGGSFPDEWVDLAVAWRRAVEEEARLRWLGFRLVLPVGERGDRELLSTWPA